MSDNGEIRPPVSRGVLGVEILMVAALVLPCMAGCVVAWVMGS